MEMVETEFEIPWISKSVSLPFEGLDFVYETSDGAPSQSVEIEGVQKSSPVGPEGVLPTLLSTLISEWMASLCHTARNGSASLRSSSRQKSLTLNCSFIVMNYKKGGCSPGAAHRGWLCVQWLESRSFGETGNGLL